MLLMSLHAASELSGTRPQVKTHQQQLCLLTNIWQNLILVMSDQVANAALRVVVHMSEGQRYVMRYLTMHSLSMRWAHTVSGPWACMLQTLLRMETAFRRN